MYTFSATSVRAQMDIVTGNCSHSAAIFAILGWWRVYCLEDDVTHHFFETLSSLAGYGLGCCVATTTISFTDVKYFASRR